MSLPVIVNRPDGTVACMVWDLRKVTEKQVLKHNPDMKEEIKQALAQARIDKASRESQ